MLKPLFRGCVLSCALFTAMHSYAASSDPVAIVNGKTLTEEDYTAYVQARTQQMKNDVDEQRLIEELVNRELVVQDAINTKLDQTPDFKAKLETIRLSLLAEAAIERYMAANELSDEVLKSEYEKIVEQIPTPKEYNTRHILVGTEEKAKSILAQLEEDGDFSELAKTHSTDKVSAENEGKLGWITTDEVVPTFGEQVAKAEVGKHYMVKSQFGWHILVVDESRNSPPPPFDSIKTNIKAMMQARLMQQYIDELHKNGKVEIVKKVADKEEVKEAAVETAPKADDVKPAEEKVEEKAEAKSEPTKAPAAQPETAKEATTSEAEKAATPE